MRWVLMLAMMGLPSCSKHYVTVRQVPVNTSYLASSHVGTPDPRQAHPPEGIKLVIDWAVPERILKEKPQVVLDLLYKDHTEERVTYPIEYRSGYVIYSLLNEAFRKKAGLLSYKAEIVTESGSVYKEWKHQLWVRLIAVGESTSEASTTSSFEEDQSKQGSVTETPKESSPGGSISV